MARGGADGDGRAEALRRVHDQLAEMLAYNVSARWSEHPDWFMDGPCWDADRRWLRRNLGKALDDVILEAPELPETITFRLIPAGELPREMAAAEQRHDAHVLEWTTGPAPPESNGRTRLNIFDDGADPPAVPGDRP